MKRIFYSILIIPIAFLYSCEDIIEVKLNDDEIDLYAVEATITTTSEPTVFFYNALSVTEDGNYTGVSGAEVTINDDASPSNSITLTESESEQGLYVVPEGTEYYGVAGRKYTLTIVHNGVTLTGTDTLAAVTAIDSIQIHSSQRGQNRYLGIFTFGTEPEGTGNYYKWEIYVNNVYLSDIDYLAFADDELVDGSYISNLEIFTDYYSSSDTTQRQLNLNDTVFVKQCSISKFVYNYYSQMVNQSSTGFLFSVPPANIESNMAASDGKTVLGLFTAQDISVSNTVVIDKSVESQLNNN